MAFDPWQFCWMGARKAELELIIFGQLESLRETTIALEWIGLFAGQLDYNIEWPQEFYLVLFLSSKYEKLPQSAHLWKLYVCVMIVLGKALLNVTAASVIDSVEYPINCSKLLEPMELMPLNAILVWSDCIMNVFDRIRGMFWIPGHLFHMNL